MLTWLQDGAEQRQKKARIIQIPQVLYCCVTVQLILLILKEEAQLDINPIASETILC